MAMLLQVKDLIIEFVTRERRVRAVDGISFGIEGGKTLGIVGESGCGKSVTALTIMRLLSSPPAQIPGGSIHFAGRDLLTLGLDELRQVRGKEIAMIFQEPMTSLNPVYTAGYQIEESLRVHFPKLTAEERKKRVIELLEKVGIPDPVRRYDNYPHEMSGGMRQRIMIAMALACNPKLLIADEPTTALDVTIQAQILELIRGLQRDLGMSLVLITHDLGVVAETADDVLVMYAGKVVEYTSVRELFRRPMHPYTVGLLHSLPSRSTNAVDASGRKRLSGIPGSVPDLTQLPPGCRFQDRCNLVQPRCRTVEPPLEEKVSGHKVACFEVSG